MARNSKVILAQGIKLDKTYKNVLCYNESQMLNLVQNNAISTFLNCSYIRDNNSIELGLSYSDCLKANYLAFQNPDYSNKWFFAFIDKVEYISNGASRILFTVDVWSTWYDYWSTRACYVLRQHDNIDYPGRNTVPENLEHGEYIKTIGKASAYFQTYYYIVLASISLNNHDPITSFGKMVLNGACYVCKTLSTLSSLIQSILAVTTPQQGEILEVYIVPSDLIPFPVTNDPFEITGNNSASALNDEVIYASKPTTLEGYTPTNKKLLTYPYCYILAGNSVGNSDVWRLEDFTSDSIIVGYMGVPSIGTSILCYPKNYKKGGLSIGLIGAKYPTLGWREDSYTNWLTQNAVNNQVKAATSGGSIVLGTIGVGAGILTGNPLVATAGVSMIASGVSGALESGAEYYQHSIEPDAVKGLISAGDVLTALGNLTYYFDYMTIKTEYAQKLDKFFTRFGYAQNEIQLPLFDNNSYRQNYNFIQIAKDQVTAVPKIVNNININAEDLDLINNIFRAGVTIWKRYDNNFANYSITNPIVNP